jgi:hypothetical protein
LHREWVDELRRSLRWPGRLDEVARLLLDRGLHLHRPPWSKEGRDPARASRRAVSVAELLALGPAQARQLDG